MTTPPLALNGTGAIQNARVAVSDFIDRAAITEDSHEAANWSLAAKNMASCLHSLVGAASLVRRGS